MRCVYVASNSVLAGFTLTGGHTLTNGDWDTDRSGGGVYFDRSGTLEGCVLDDNACDWPGGGAIFMSGGVLRDSVLSRNGAVDAGAAACM